MKKRLLQLAILPFMLSCNGQNTSKTNEFVSSTDLKGEIWHTRIHRYGGTIVKEFHPNRNAFSDDIFLSFLDKDSIQLKHSRYSPSIGWREVTIKGTYQVDNKNEISITFTEPKDTFGRHTVSIGEKEVQYSLYTISRVNKNEASQTDITQLPEIKAYHFKIIEILDENNITTELTLLDNNGAKYTFGKYKFDTNKESINEY